MITTFRASLFVTKVRLQKDINPLTDIIMCLIVSLFYFSEYYFSVKHKGRILRKKRVQISFTSFI